jgi:predicted transcriptional regulator
MAIMISIKPEYCEKILNGEKTIEIRKSIPKCDLPQKVYIYCTNSGEILREFKYLNGRSNERGFYIASRGRNNPSNWNGKVIAEFNLKEYDTFKEIDFISLKQACLTQEEIENYSNGKIVFGWHIDDLVVYDKPKELGEFRKPCPYAKEGAECYPENCKMCAWYTVIRPPQSWCYVEDLKGEN